jgi:hypothetical protein
MTPRDDDPPTVPPLPDPGDPRHAADAAFFRSIVDLGQRTASRTVTETEKSSRRRTRRRFGRTVLVAIVGLLVLGGGAVATKVFVADDGSVPVEPDPGRDIAQTPGDRRLGAARAKDPKNAHIWGVRVYYNDRGDSCVLVGVVSGRRLGEIKAGKFKEYTKATPGLCDNLSDHILTTARAYVDSAEPRTVLYGVVDRSIVTLDLQTPDGRRHPIPIAPDGSYVLPLVGRRPLASRTTLTAYTSTGATTTFPVKTQPPPHQLTRP